MARRFEAHVHLQTTKDRSMVTKLVTGRS